MHFVPLPRSVIAGVGGFEMLYLAVFQLFRWIGVSWAFQFQLFQFFILTSQQSLIQYITIYISISYILYRGVYIPQILIGTIGTGTL